MRPFRTRERVQDWVTFRADLPHGVLVPAEPRRRWPGIRAAAPLLVPVRRVARSLVAEVAVFLLLAAVVAALPHTMLAQVPPPSQWPSPSSPPVQVCGNPAYLNGPSSPPVGAVTVPAGDNSAFFQYQLPADTTYWFAPGTHTQATGLFGPFDAINPGNNDVLTGAPGAVVDGMAYNYEAIGGNANNVTIEYLTFTGFHTPGGQGAVAANGGTGWTIQNSTVENTIPGSGLYLGTGDTAQDNCITENGQQGFAAYTTTDASSLTGGPTGVDVNSNEISYNDTCNWEAIPGGQFPITPPSGCSGAGQFSGCGCSGAGKFWESDVSEFEGNYVHNDYSAGPWWDTNNTGATITGNYIANEWAVGIIYEISYNGYIAGNTFVDDAWGVGPYNPGFPSSAVYINASGSDPRVPGPYGTVFAITGNSFINDWGGVVLYETADRFCSSVANTSTGECTLVNLTAPLNPSASPQGPRQPLWRRGLPGAGRTYGNFSPPGPVVDLHTCSELQYVSVAPWVDDCRWKTQNVDVTGNLFAYDPATIGVTCTLGNYCGFNGLFSNYGVTPPYLAYYTANNITYHQDDLFAGNTYCGPWQFDAFAQGNDYDFATWQAAPYAQDPGSTLNGPACAAVATPPPPGGKRAPVPMPVQVPGRAGRH